MNLAGIFRGVVSWLMWLALAVLLARSAGAAAGVEEKFDVLKTRTGTYSNVTVTTKAKNYIFISNTTGLRNVKISDLTMGTQQRLGYTPDPKNSFVSDDPTPAKSEVPVVVEPSKTKLAALSLQKYLPQSWLKYLPSEMPVKLPKIAFTTTMLLAVLGIAMVFYLFFCVCCSLICRKTGNEPGILVWLPVFQLFPMLRAAGMSPLWFLAYLVPGVNIFAQIVWCVNISKARGKSIWVALFLLLPITSFFAFLYLAFSGSDAPPEKGNGERQVMVLQTA